MNKFTKGLSLAALALALGGIAHAQAEQRGWGDPDAGKTVTRAEAQAKAETKFAEMDANKDGVLNQADRAAHMGHMFDKFDTDHNGSLSRDEFIAAHQKGPMGEGMGHGPAGGPGMDGGPGKRGEHGGRGGRGEHRGGGMMMLKMADANNDGNVTKAEFVAGALKHFDMADANKDGKLTPEERKAARAKMREHMGQMKGKMRGKHGDHGGMDMPPPPPPPGA